MEITTELVGEWAISLKAARKSAQTVHTYTQGVLAFLAWAQQTGVPAEPTRRALDAFSVYLSEERGNSDATIASRQLSLRRMCQWLCDEEIATENPLATYPIVRAKAPVMQPLSAEELASILATCKPVNVFDNARDDALIRLMAETGLRASEAVNLRVDDLDLPRGTATVREGKGGKHRMVGFGAHTSSALARYLRLRASHPLAGGTKLWLGTRGRDFTYDALHKRLGERAQAAGIDRFHPHLLRNTFAHRWLEKGGSVPALMAQGGWTSIEMVNRYAKFHANTRAISEAQRLDLGDI